MGAFDLQSLLNLSVAQRIELVETIWDSVTIDAQTLPIHESERAEIELRLSEHERQSQDVVPWSEVKAALLI